MPILRLILSLVVPFSCIFAQDVLTNEAILKLVKASLSEDVVIAIVIQQPGRYSVSPHDMLTSKSAEATDKVLAAMINKMANPVPNGAPIPSAGSSSKISVPHMVSVDSWDTGYFVAAGNWTRVDGKNLNENQAVQLSCYQFRNGASRGPATCVEAIAEYSNGLLVAKAEMYNVERWDREFIRLEARKEICGSFYVVVHRQPPLVTGSSIKNKNAKSEFCKGGEHDPDEHLVLNTTP